MRRCTSGSRREKLIDHLPSGSLEDSAPPASELDGCGGTSVLVEPSCSVCTMLPSAFTLMPIVTVRLPGMSVVVEPSGFACVIVPSGFTMSLGVSGLVGGVESDGPLSLFPGSDPVSSDG